MTVEVVVTVPTVPIAAADVAPATRTRPPIPGPLLFVPPATPAVA
jgi:hypothetical protein